MSWEDSSNGISVKDIQFTKVIPTPHLQPQGLLPNRVESCALWMFLVCAVQALDKIPAQVTLEGELDRQADLMQIAHSIRKQYELDTLEVMFSAGYVHIAKREAERCRLKWNPALDIFFHTAGAGLRHLDRNPDKVFQ